MKIIKCVAHSLFEGFKTAASTLFIVVVVDIFMFNSNLQQQNFVFLLAMFSGYILVEVLNHLNFKYIRSTYLGKSDV